MNYIVKELSKIEFNMINEYSYFNEETIENAYRCERFLNRHISNLFSEYNKSKEVYYEDLRYYKKFGGVYPTNNLSDIRNTINYLIELRDVLRNFTEFDRRYTKFDLGIKYLIKDILDIIESC